MCTKSNCQSIGDRSLSFLRQKRIRETHGVLKVRESLLSEESVRKERRMKLGSERVEGRLRWLAAHRTRFASVDHVAFHSLSGSSIFGGGVTRVTHGRLHPIVSRQSGSNEEESKVSQNRTKKAG